MQAVTCFWCLWYQAQRYNGRVKDPRLQTLSVLYLLLALVGCSRSPTSIERVSPARIDAPPTDGQVSDKRSRAVTFRVVDAATGELLRDVTAIHERFRANDSRTSAKAVTNVRPRLSDASITASMDSALDHYVRFTCDGYYQVRVRIESWSGGQEPRVFVEPVVWDLRPPYFTPLADIIVIGLSKMEGSRHGTIQSTKSK